MYNANKKLIPGADAIDCQLEDINGKTIKLSDLYGKVLYLDIWATWCGPCQMLAPIVGEISEAHPEIIVGKVNADEEMELVQRFKAAAIPMLVLMKNGEIVKKSVGYKTREELEAELF